MRISGPIKIRLFIFSASMLVICASTQNCNNPGPQTKSENEASDTTKNIDTTNIKYTKDMETYKKQMSDTLTSIDTAISKFREKMKKEGKEAKIEYNKGIAELDQRGKELRKKLEEYKEKGKEKWDVFKTDFTKDMDTLSKQLKDLTSKKT
jgi:hypothetical protein